MSEDPKSDSDPGMEPSRSEQGGADTLPLRTGTAPGALTARELLQRQNELLDLIRESLAPDEIEGRLRKLVARIFVAASFATGAVLGTWELGTFVFEQIEKRDLISNWVEVSRQAYEAELNAAVALEFLSAAEELDPQSPDIVRLKAYITGMEVAEELLNLDRPKNQTEVDRAAVALGQANLLIQVDPDLVDGHLLKGQIYAALGDPDRAAVHLADAMSRDPNHAIVHMRLAVVEWRLFEKDGDPTHLDRARSLLAQACSLDPGGQGEKWARHWEGVLAQEVDLNDEAAMSAYQRAIEIDPRFHLSLLNLAKLHGNAARWRAGLETLWDYLALKPADSKAWSEMAEQLGYQNRYPPALAYASRATEVNPGSFKAWELRALLEYEIAKVSLERRGQADEDAVASSRSSAEAALALDPSNKDVYLQLAKLERQFGDLGQAGESIRQAEMFAPEDPAVQEEFAFYHLATGNPDLAIEAARRSIEVDPENADQAYLLVARASRELGDLDAAMEAIVRAKAVAWDSLPAILVEEALIQSRRGDPVAAFDLIGEAMAEDPNRLASAVAWMELAVEQGDPQEASQALATVRSLAPDHVELERWSRMVDAVPSG